MSAIGYREPYQLPAGILALAVHVAFFALLYFGFSWQTQQMQSAPTMRAELWQSLPEPVIEPPVQLQPEESASPTEAITKPEITQPPEKIVEPEIAMPDKKKPEARPVVEKPDKKKSAPEKKVEHKPTKQEMAAKQEIEARNAEQVLREQAERAAQTRSEQASGRVFDEYTGKIVNKIRRNIVMPPNVANDARAEFSVTLLPGGTVLNTRLTRSSGNVAYDNAVERAILKSQPLPLPADVEMFKNFRDLKLVFKPVE